MSIKVFLPQGVSEITVNGLHQWDYGRTIEIHSDDLPALVEVHFACAGMKDAVVRSCSVVDGVATAAVPDLCLEQTTPVYAWVYIVSETQGVTRTTITLPITARTRPQPEASIPRDNSDAYTAFIAEVNKAVGALQDGTVTVEKARVAERLEMGGDVSVGHAETANFATYASILNDYASPDSTRKIQIGLSGETLRPGQFHLLAAYEQDAEGANTGRIKDVALADVSVGHAAEADSAKTATMADGAQVVTGDKMTVSSNKVVNVTTQGLYSVTVREPNYNRLETVMLYVVPGMYSQALFISSVTYVPDLGLDVPVRKCVYYDPSTQTIFCDEQNYRIVSAYLIQTPNQ